MSSDAVVLRLVTEADEEFLQCLFSACRHSEFALLGEPLATELVSSQFVASRRDWASRFDTAGDHIIDVEDVPVGRMWVHGTSNPWELVDIAVLPEFRSRGIAGTLLRDLVEQADASAATIRLSVRTDNVTAQRLYFRLGFRLSQVTTSIFECSFGRHL